MANDDKIRGLVPVQHPNGNNFGVRWYKYDTAASRMFKGDVVVMQADGHITSWLDDVGGVVLGVAAAKSTVGSAGSIPVYDDPNIVYEVQADSVSNVATTGVGANFTIVTATPSTLDISRYELDASSAAATASATRVLTLVGFSKVVNSDGTANTPGASHVKCLVVINRSLFKAQAPNI